jgi:hypothetical protein
MSPEIKELKKIKIKKNEIQRLHGRDCEGTIKINIIINDNKNLTVLRSIKC